MSWLVVLVLLLLPALANAAQVTATLDRSQVQLGETVTLNVRVDGGSSDVAMPDLQPLSQDFQILGTSQNSSISVVNGAASSNLTFGIALRPRRVGTLEIPALRVAGEETAPQSLQVSAPAAGAASAGRDVFMEASASPQHAYVGQQLSYVVRLFYAISISNGAFNEPSVSGMEVTQIGKNLQYDAERGGRMYHVLERRYALVPQQAGRIEIPAASFEGEAIDRNDPDSFFGSSTPVSAAAAAVSVQVNAPPADWGKSAWLPARALTLQMDGWPAASDPVRVGQPLNLTMTLQATGLPFEALPALSLPDLEGAKAYPDKPVNGTQQDGEWLLGKRQQSFAIVPERAGTLTIPATTVKWWNVTTDRMEVATIAARDVTVLPGVGVAAPPSTPLPQPDADAVSTKSLTVATPWRWIALASIALWVISMLVWWSWRRRRSLRKPRLETSKPLSARECQLAFLTAARGGDASAQTHTLLAWARAERPGMQNLGALADALADRSQHDAIDALQRQRYARGSSADDDDGLAKAFKGGFVWRSTDPNQEQSGLPPLYPFKLR